MTYAVFDIGASVYWVRRRRRRGTRPARRRARRAREPPAVRRMMVEYGEQFWRDGWGSLYSVFGGNPLAAMPSLHFATSVMAALLLAEVGPVAGALGFAYAATLGFALVYLGEHYVVDLLARRGADGGGAPARRRARRRRWPRVGRARRGAGGDGPRGDLRREGRRARRSDGVRGRAAATRRAERRTASGAPRRRRRRGRAHAPRRRCRACVLTRRQVVALRRVRPRRASAFLYFVLPKLAGVGTTVHRIERGDSWWIAIGVLLELLSFAGYVVLFRAVFVRGHGRIGWRESYQITMAGLAATRLFAAAGAGGVALTAWALRRSGMEPRARRLPDGRVHGAAVRRSTRARC